jgi:glycosyltransferase involved in cell wall biosynthesis
VKIALLGTRGVPARYGGFETFAERLGIGLVERGHDVTVFCERSNEDELSSYKGIQLRYVSVPECGPAQTVLFDLKCLWLARKGFDVVYMLGYGAAPFCLIPQLWNSEVWINPDGLEWARSKWGRFAKAYFKVMEWLAVRIPDRLIADAEAIRKSLAERHGHLPACSVIPYGCDIVDDAPNPTVLELWNLKPQDYYLVLCRLEPENHVMEIVRAFERSGSQRKLVIVGNHLISNDYLNALRTINDPRIFFVGTVYDQHQVSALRWHAYGYLHGHCVGGTNPSLLEAMGCGNLVFAHDNPFNRETLADSGIYFESIDDLTARIEWAEHSDSALDVLRRGARRRARLNYSWEGIIGRYSELLVENGAVELHRESRT